VSELSSNDSAVSTGSMEALADEIARHAAQLSSACIMEVCGTHTVSIFRAGIRSLLPKNVRLVSGPGCPVCVTPQGYIDVACELARQGDITVCTYGDMVRVPGRGGSLARARAKGGDVHVVYSAHDAVEYAAAHPDRQVVFLAVGFETTAPATALSVLEAQSRGLKNFTALLGHKLAVPAMMALLEAGDVELDGFLSPGHVSVVIGADAYKPIVERHQRSCVVAGFEPRNMLAGIARLLELLVAKSPAVDNVYSVAVRPGGNPSAQAVLERVFEPIDTGWRAIGTIAQSGLGFREAFWPFDAQRRYGLEIDEDYHPAGCLCGDVIQGKVEPPACTLFGTSCTPARPIGPCMVSSEGTCAAWYKYGGAR
jgi:hydrogenase expression/formation protein HypD